MRTVRKGVSDQGGDAASDGGAETECVAVHRMRSVSAGLSGAGEGNGDPRGRGTDLAAVLTDRTGKMENNGNFYISDLKKQKIAFIFLSCGRGRSSGRSRRICSWIRNGF